MEQSRVTDYFGKRKVYRSPAQKRRKMAKGLVESLKEEPKSLPMPMSSATPEVNLAAAAEKFIVVSERKHKGEVSNRLRLGEAESPAPCGSLSATRRQLDFSKIRRQASPNETPKSPVQNLFSGPPSPTQLPSMDLDNFQFGSGEKSTVSAQPSISPTKLQPALIKKKLGKVANLQQLRDRLATFSDVAIKLNQQVRDTSIANATDSAGELEKLNQQTKTGKLTSLSPSKEATAAFERFQHLVAPEGPQLELSANYRRLDETFDSSDTVVSLMFNRAEVVTFSKLKSGIQQMTRKNFEIKHLGQIKTVYPEAYVLEIQKVRSILPEERGKAKLELTIAPNIETDLVNYKSLISAYPVTPKKGSSENCANPPSPVKKWRQRSEIPKSPVKTPTKGFSRDSLSANRRICRRAIFRHNLLEILKEKHREFLLTLDPPVRLEEAEEAQLRRWHPKFLTSDIPEVSAATDIPQVSAADPVFSAKDFLNSAKPNLPKEVHLALEATASKTVETPKTPETKSLPKAPQFTGSKGLPAALLKKIREKEALKNQMEMLRNPAEEAKEMRMSRLPDLIRIIQAQFTTENKSSLPFVVVERKLTESYRSLIAASEIRHHIDLLKEVLPNWVSEVHVSDSGGYLKIDRKVKMSDLLQQLEKTSKKRS